jgi:hypothetical protein
MDEDSAKTVVHVIERNRLLRTYSVERRASQVSEAEASNLVRTHLNREIDDLNSTGQFVPRTITQSELSFERLGPIKSLAAHTQIPRPTSGDGVLKFKRAREPKGPPVVFGFDYFAVRVKAAGKPEPKLLSYEGLWGSGEEYAYEVLNFADAKRNAQEIRDAVSAEYGPVSLEMVVEYLKALEKIGILEEAK